MSDNGLPDRLGNTIGRADQGRLAENLETPVCQRDHMGDAGLNSLRRDHPLPGFLIDLGPLGEPNLRGTGGREDQELEGQLGDGGRAVLLELEDGPRADSGKGVGPDAGPPLPDVLGVLEPLLRWPKCCSKAWATSLPSLAALRSS